MYLLNPLARVSCLFCLPPLYFLARQDVHDTAKSVFDLQRNLPDAILDYCSSNDANGGGRFMRLDGAVYARLIS